MQDCQLWVVGSKHNFAQRERSRNPRRARPQAPPESPEWAGSPPYGNPAYQENGAYSPGPVESGPRPDYYAESLRRPMYNGPAYPPPGIYGYNYGYNGYNAPPPGYYSDDYYSYRWRRGPMPPW